MSDYDIVIGLEIHAELDTKTKVFCRCRNEFGAMPNTQVCPVCLGLPGALPIINRKAVEYCIMAGLSFDCDINDQAVFERKNYFYPDLSKAYQISQLDKPICLHGGIRLKSGKFIRFNRIHLEEDAAKLIHVSEIVGTYIDYNRGGTPLIEMVTEPDLSSSDEVIEFLNKLRQTLIYSGVSKCRMEEGGMKLDVNLSVKPKGYDKLGTRVEIKNLNSFKAVERAILYEAQRHIEIIESGDVVKQQTLGWDDNKGKTYLLREKENEKDYRYFPDPDILDINITKEDIERLRKKLPELVSSKKKRYVEMGLSDYDVDILLSDKVVSNYFDEVCKRTNNPKESANWIMTEVLRVYNERKNEELEDIISADNLSEIINLVLAEKVTRVNAKKLFEEVLTTGIDAQKLLSKLDLVGDVNKKDIVDIMGMIINDSPDIVEKFETNSDDIINYCIGNIMKHTSGKAKPEYVRPLIIEILKSKQK